MPVRVRIPTPLRKLTSNQELVEAEGGNVAQVLKSLEARYPGLPERICDETGELRRFVNLYLNEEDVRFLQNLATPVKPGDELSIIPAIAGGARVRQPGGRCFRKGARASKAGKLPPAGRRVYLTFPRDLVERPLIWEAGHHFKVVTNIRGASVSEEIGIVALEFCGEAKEIERALSWLARQGVKVEPIEKSIVEG